MKESSYIVTGLSCAGGSERVRRLTEKLPGVIRCEVNGVTGRIYVGAGDEGPDFEKVREAVEKAGYGLEKILEERPKYKKAEKTLLIRSVTAVACALPVLALSLDMLSRSPIVVWLELNAAIQLLLTSAVLVCGARIFKNGYKSLFHFSPNMDSLVALGATAAMAQSVYSTVMLAAGHTEYGSRLYYGTAAVVVALVMLGRYMETRILRRTGDVLQEMKKLRPDTAHIIYGGRICDGLAAQLVPGNEIEIRPGEAVPADAVVIAGRSSVDESMLTGKTEPAEKSPGKEITGGCVNIDGALHARVTAPAGDGTLDRIIKTVEESRNRQAPTARLADRVAGVFIPVVILIALAASVSWAIAGQSALFCLNIFIGVLVAACPCALGLAAPLSIMAGTARGAQYGVLFKSGEALECLAGARTAVFNKTGTLTRGTAVLHDVIPYGETREEAVKMASAAEFSSNHPVGRAIHAMCPEAVADKFVNLPGQGVQAQFEGHKLLVGSRCLMLDRGVDITAARIDEQPLYDSGRTVIYAAADGVLFAVFGIADEIRPEAGNVISTLQKIGVKAYILSGDNPATVHAAARECGISTKNVSAGIMPDKKAEFISKIRKKRCVAMIGDGINDAAALSAADVGITMAGYFRTQAENVAASAADVILMRGEIKQCAAAFLISRASMRNMCENLFWAFIYNMLCVPAAAGVFYIFGGVLLSPLWAGAAMALSGMCVALNAWRLRFYKPKY